MKKFLLFLVALFISIFAFAYDVQIDGIYYNLDHENMTAEVTNDGLDENIGDYDVGYFQTSIVIPEVINYGWNASYIVTSIGDSAFWQCYYLNSIVLPESIISIGVNSFSGCESLSVINIPDGVNTIGLDAFNGCSSLASINIPAGVNEIGFFDNCSSLMSIEVSNGNDYYTSIDGVLYSKDERILIRCPEAKKIINQYSAFTLAIEQNAFAQCSITSIEIYAPTIGRNAFGGCENLTSVKFFSVPTFEDFTFAGCSSLKEINVPDYVTNLGKGAFRFCSSLISFTIPNSVTIIDEDLFRFCSSLKSVNIHNKVTSIGVAAFSECTSLTSILLPNSITRIERGAFAGCFSLFSIKIPSSTTFIGNNAFGACTLLDTITCLGTTPPEASNLEAKYETCILFVPKGSLNDYQNHTEWGKFLNIQELKGEKYTITTAVNDESMGSVIGEGEYEKDSEITLTVTANEGYRFVKWSDGNIENPRTITVTQDSTFTAIFELEEYALYATSASPELGYVEHIIRAIAIEGFEFDGWSDGNTDNPRTIVLTEDTKLYAYFRMAQGGNPVDLETSKISSANIYTTNGTLHVENATENYHILDAAGRLIYSGNASTIQLPRGIYLITMGGEVEKIVL